MPERSASELGGQISVDLEADADFDENWRGPGHKDLPLNESATLWRQAVIF
jgi:hypothetical protein